MFAQVLLYPHLRAADEVLISSPCRHCTPLAVVSVFFSPLPEFRDASGFPGLESAKGAEHREFIAKHQDKGGCVQIWGIIRDL